jgi:hypothetical protein
MNTIGQWAHRRGQKSHLIESERADRYVMRCGREMTLFEGIGRKVLVFGGPTWSNPACYQCNGHQPTLSTRGTAP